MTAEKKNKKWPVEFKNKVVQEYLTGNYTVKELAKKYGFEHDPTRIYKWRHELNQSKQGDKIEDLKTQGYSFEQARKIQELEAEILEYQKNFADKEVTILDLGTGSGAIAVTLATLVPQAKIIAIDISDEALALATENAKLHGAIAQIQFIKSDWYSNLPAKKFDFIISNPPYISPDNKIYMAQETILYEPEHALFAVENGLINYRKIIFGLNNFLKNENKVFLEIGFNQAKDVINIIKEYSFTEIIISKDLSGHDRVIEFRFV